MCFGLQWQLSFPGKHAFGHRHYTAHTLHVCIIFRQIFSEKKIHCFGISNKAFRWDCSLQRGCIKKGFDKPFPQISFIPKDPNVWLFHVGVSKFCNPPKCLLILVEIQYSNGVLSLGPYRNKTLCVSLYPNPMAVGSLFFVRWKSSQEKSSLASDETSSWISKFKPAAPVDKSPWGQTAEVFVASPWDSLGVFRWPKRIPSSQIMNHSPPRFWNSICDVVNDCTTHLWIQNSC